MSVKILIADDEPNILLCLEYLMKREGFQVLVAHNGQEALDMIEREQPVLALLDVMMPKKTGLEVCHLIRSGDTNKDMPILLLTAKGRDTDIAKGLALGANAYIVKPFSTKDLVQKVKSIIGTSA